MVDAKLDKHDQVFVDNVFFPVGPAPDACAASRLVGVLSTCIEFTIPIFHLQDY